jgi:replicative DNA helicase
MSTSIDNTVLLPADEDCERAYLGSLLLLGADRPAFNRAVAALGSTGNDVFVGEDFRVIYDAIIAVASRCGAFDAVLVRAELVDRGQWEQIGDLPALVRLLHAVPSAAHAEHYARRLVELWRRRRAWRIGAGLARRMLPDQTAEQTADLLRRAIAALQAV